MADTPLPTTLAKLRASGWRSRTVKEEVRENFLRMLRDGSELFPAIVGYDDTVIPTINVALLAGHDMLFLGEKGQAKSRLMRLLVRFLDEHLPYLDDPAIPLHDDPYAPITAAGRRLVSDRDPEDVPIAWWPRAERYAERLAPGTKFADIIGEIDPAKLATGTSMASEEALHLGLIPRMHRGIFAMNELPELDELVQVGMFNILEERDVQIRGYPVKFDLDVMLLFSANPSTYNRSGKVIPQLKDRIGSVPHFMKQVLEQITIAARRSKFIDQQSGVSARFSIANYETMVASARQRGVRLGERPAVPRISDLGHIYASSLGKLELDLMGSHQMTERQVLDAVVADAIGTVFEEYVEAHGLEEITTSFGRGVRIEVGDTVPSADYERLLEDVPAVWEKAFEVNAARDPAVRASCIEFVLAGLYATERISRIQSHGRTTYDTGGLR